MEAVVRMLYLVRKAELWKATIKFVMSVLLPLCQCAWNNSAPTGRIFMKFDI